MKTIKKTIFEVDYNDFDQAVNDFLKSKGYAGRDFEIAVDHELSNDSNEDFSVGEYAWNKVEESDKKEILSGNFGWRGGAILNWMYEDGLIEAGNYLVKISW